MISNIKKYIFSKFFVQKMSEENISSINQIDDDEPIILDVKNENNEEKLIEDINKNTSKEPKRYFGIDLIRVLACFLVIEIHSGQLYYIDSEGGLIKSDKNIWPGIFNSLATVCVPLFVMISGYLLLPMKTDYSTFLKKRFTRILFPYIAFNIFYNIYFYLRGFFDLKTMLLNIPKMFINFSIGHLWYIYMIIGVYLYVPIITPWIKTAEKKHFYYYFVIWIISSFYGYLHLIYDGIWGEAFWNKSTIVQSFIGYSGYAVLGAFIKLHLKENNLYILGIVSYIAGTSVTMFGYFYRREEATTTEEIEVTWRFDSTNVALASFGVFLLLRKVECKNKIITKIFNDLALKSYGMYLIYIFFIHLFGYIFDAPKQNPISGTFVVAILTFISSYSVIKAISYIPYSQYIVG